MVWRLFKRTAACFGILLAACGSGDKEMYQNLSSKDANLMASMTKKLEALAYVRRMGISGFVVYLDRSIGKPIEADRGDGLDITKVIRVMIRLGGVPDSYENYQSHARLIKEEAGYELWSALNESISPHGLIVFTSGEGRKVYVDIRGGGNFLARTSFRDGFEVEYLYHCNSLLQHGEVNQEVESWLATIPQ